MLHPHHDIITAYLEGKTIERYIPHMNTWMELEPVEDVLIFPTFNKESTYRVKQEITNTSLQIYFDEEDNVHKTWSNTQYPNLRLYWLEGQLVNAEVIK